MNEQDMIPNNQNKNTTYRATSNLNTAIENPQINMNSAVGVNIENVEQNYSTPYYDDSNRGAFSVEDSNTNYSSSDSNSFGQSTTMPDSQMYQSNSNYDTVSSNENIAYVPTLEEKKKHGSGFHVSREFKIMLFIVFILFIFVLLLPYIFDFFKGLELEFAAR